MSNLGHRRDERRESLERIRKKHGESIAELFESIEYKFNNVEYARVVLKASQKSYMSDSFANQVCRLLVKYRPWRESLHILDAAELDIFEDNRVYELVEKSFENRDHLFVGLSKLRSSKLERVLAVVDKKEDEERNCVVRSISKILSKKPTVLDRYLNFFDNNKCYKTMADAISHTSLDSNIEVFIDIFEKYQGISLITIAHYISEDVNVDYSYIAGNLKDDNIIKLVDIYQCVDILELANISNVVSEYSAPFLEERVIKEAKVNDNLNYLMSIRSRIYGSEEFLEAFDLIKKFGFNFKDVQKQYSNPYYMLKAMEKYPNLQGMLKIGLEDKVYDFKELLSEAATESINNSVKALLPIINSNYSRERDKITDPIATRISYKDLDLIHNTWEFVREIHTNRPDKIVEIEKGYYRELNRAISQGSNDKKKIANLRQYCNEVQKQMKENASDLMVIYDAI